jgi:hypothetical protein
MRPLFVLGSRIFLVIVGGLCSSLLLRTLASRLTRGTGEAGRRAAKAATWRPLGVMGVWLVGFIGYAVLGVYAFNRLPGGSRVPPRSSTGYTLEEDAPNFGSIYPPNHLYGPLPSEDRIFDLQVDGSWAAGATEVPPDPGLGGDPNPSYLYFLLDMRDGNETIYGSLGALNADLAKHGLRNHFKPFGAVFRHYRAAWFDWLACAVEALVPIAALGLLAWLIARARQTVREDGVDGGV